MLSMPLLFNELFLFYFNLFWVDLYFINVLITFTWWTTRLIIIAEIMHALNILIVNFRAIGLKNLLEIDGLLIIPLEISVRKDWICLKFGHLCRCFQLRYLLVQTLSRFLSLLLLLDDCLSGTSCHWYFSFHSRNYAAGILECSWH